MSRTTVLGIHALGFHRWSLTRCILTLGTALVVISPSALGQAPAINGKEHMGQEKVAGVLGGYTSGNVTEYTEGDPINFRFTLSTNDPGTTPPQFEGQMQVRFSLESATCTFFDPMFTLGTHDGSAPAIEVITGAAPTVTPVGAPFADGTEWVQLIDIVYPDPDSEARINYWLKISDNIGDCMGSSQHSRLDGSDTPGDYAQTGQQNVPVPANQIIRIGACCFADGSCQDLTEDECDAAMGDYQGDDSLCDPNPCPQPLGACCFDDGSCIQFTEELCIALSGDFQGDFTLCAPNPCPQPPGACCFDDGSCQELTEELCVAQGGDFQGDFTVCDPNPCPQPPGACCFDDGSCQELTEELCIAQGGDFQGDFTACDPNPCPQPPGACCFDDGSCQELTEELCIAQGGDFQGDFTACDPNPCPQPPGACCFDDGSCQELTEELCIAQGGDFQGDFTACDPNPCPEPERACCLPDGSCENLLPGMCAHAGGGVAPEGIMCDDIECPPNNTCKEAIPITAGGTPFSNIGATTDGPEVCDMGADIWYKYEAPTTGILKVLTCYGTDFDTVIAVYDSCGCPAMESSLVDCNDDYCGSQSKVVIDVCAGDCYLIQVGGYEGEMGMGLLKLIEILPDDCGDEDSGNCFNAQGQCNPHCNDEKCCNLICGIDPFCCTMTWDHGCVDLALVHCGDCGGANAGNCYADNGSAGCNDADCCQAVCQVDPACCHVTWDTVCADEAENLCQGDPLPCPGEGACRFANGTPGCEDQECCELICSLDPGCCVVDWDQGCADQAIEICPNIAVCPGEGDCFAPNGSAGCDDETCCEIVCEKRPSCCGIDWDQECVEMAESMCIATCPGDGDCFTSNGTPGCEDEDCCKAVCHYDNYCCLVQWDDGCVNAADKLCDECPCDLNQDHAVGLPDLMIILERWSDAADAGDIADVNNDGEVNTLDLFEVIFHWGGC